MGSIQICAMQLRATTPNRTVIFCSLMLFIQVQNGHVNTSILAKHSTEAYPELRGSGFSLFDAQRALFHPELGLQGLDGIKGAPMENVLRDLWAFASALSGHHQKQPAVFSQVRKGIVCSVINA